MKVRIEVDSVEFGYPQGVDGYVGLKVVVEDDGGGVIAEGEPDTVIAEGDEYELEFSL